MSFTVSLTNQKGGVGKTQSAANLAYALSTKNQRVLAIDADPQSSLTLYLGLNPVELEASQSCLHHALIHGKPLAEVIQHLEDFDLVPASIRMAREARSLIGAVDSLTRLKKVLTGIASEYDFIILDTPPSFTDLFLNTLVAADGVIVPIKTDQMSAFGFSDIVETVGEIRRELNPRLQIIGVIPTMYQKNYSVDERVLNDLYDLSVGRFEVFPPVRRSTRYDKAFDEEQPALKLYPDTPGIESYAVIADYLINHAAEVSGVVR